VHMSTAVLNYICSLLPPPPTSTPSSLYLIALSMIPTYSQISHALGLVHRYYRTHNKDLTQIMDPFQLWEHFVTLGEFEGRPFRFTCENPIT